MADRTRPWLLPAVLTAFTLVALGYPTYDWYFDGLTFAMAMEGVAGGGDPAWLVHPHHLLYTPAAYAVWRGLAAAGLAVRAWLVLQWLSTACALVALGLVHRLLRKSGTAPLAAVAAVAALAASFGFWQFGSDGHVTMPETAALVALAALAARLAWATPGPAAAAAFGAAQGGAILLHETAILFVPAALVALARAVRPGRRTAVLAGFLAAAAAVALAGYATASITVLHHRHLAEFLRWAAGYFGADPRAGYPTAEFGWSPSALGATARAFAAMTAGPGQPWPVAATVGLALAAAVALGARPVFAPRRRTAGPAAFDRHLRTVLLVWVATHAAFFLWWNPGELHFWVLALPAWTMLAVPGAGLLRSGRPPRPAPRLAWTAAALVALAVWSGPARRAADPATNAELAVAEGIADRTEPAATVVVAGVGAQNALKAYVPYVARRRMLVLDWQFSDATRTPAQRLADLRARLATIRAAGPLYATSDVLGPDLDAHFLARHGLAGDARRALFAAFHPRRVAPLGPGLDLLRL